MRRLIREGDIVEGKITGVQQYGIFIKLTEECSGLVHASELEKLESENPARYFKIGQVVKVKVLRIKPGGKQAVLRFHRTQDFRKRIGAINYETESGFSSLEKNLPRWVQNAVDKGLF